MSSEIILPRIMQIGADASRQLPEIVRELGCSRPLLISDKTMTQLGYVAQIQTRLAEAGIVAELFDETVPEPTVASIAKGVEMVAQGNFDCLLALGGGSPIDSAKAISVLGSFGGEMRDYKVPRVVDELGLPVIAIPTTAGTGSEATRFTVITDEATDEKMLCMGKAFMPVAAIVDYKLTMSLPARTTADTGIDALTHAIESYVSKKANPYSQTQSLAAMTLLAPNLRTAFHDGDNEQAREAMMLGASLAGIAFSNSSVALVHGMSRPVGAFFHVPHGLSNAMLLPAVTEFSIPGSEQAYADCAVAMGVADQSDSHAAACAKLMNELRALNEELEVPSLQEFGASLARFEQVKLTMAEQALASGSPGNNPRVPSIAEMLGIYDQLW